MDRSMADLFAHSEQIGHPALGAARGEPRTRIKPVAAQRGLGMIAFAVSIALGAAGCGGDSDEAVGDGGGAIDLTRLLPADGYSYTSVDVVALKRDLELPADTSVMGSGSDAEVTLANFTSSSLGGLYSSNPARAVLDALDLPAVTAVASSFGKGNEAVSALSTSADTETIRSRLRALGFVDHGGVLEGPDGLRATGTHVRGRIVVVNNKTDLEGLPSFPHGPLAVRIDKGGLLLSGDGDLLRSLPTTLGELPLEIEAFLEGDAMRAIGPIGGCLDGEGVVTNLDGSGRLAFLVSGGADASKFSSDSSEGLGDHKLTGTSSPSRLIETPPYRRALSRPNSCPATTAKREGLERRGQPRAPG